MMIFTDAFYFRGPDGNVACIVCKLNGNTICIPLDPDNTHYREIMRQVDSGSLTIAEDSGE